jgi:hypothetical protein
MNNEKVTENSYGFLPSGQYVYVEKVLDNGFLVYNCYEKEIYSDFLENISEDVFVDTHLYFVSIVVKELPKNKEQLRIEKLNNEITELNNKKNKIIDETEKYKKEHKKIIEDIEKKLPVFKRIDDFLNKKFTHVVLDDIEIYDINDKRLWNDSYPRYFRLISLFGKSDGNLEWGINEYYDGSRSWRNVDLCFSYEEAAEIVKKRLIEKLEKTLSEARPNNYFYWHCQIYLEAAKKHSIEIPKDLLLKAIEVKREQDEFEIEEKQKKIEEIKKTTDKVCNFIKEFIKE